MLLSRIYINQVSLVEQVLEKVHHYIILIILYICIPRNQAFICIHMVGNIKMSQKLKISKTFIRIKSIGSNRAGPRN